MLKVVLFRQIIHCVYIVLRKREERIYSPFLVARDIQDPLVPSLLKVSSKTFMKKEGRFLAFVKFTLLHKSYSFVYGE